MSLSEVTLDLFQLVLVSKLTQYDQKESVRWPNIYRLGHLLEAAQNVEDAWRGAGYRDATPESLAVFVDALAEEFIYERGEFALAPVRNVARQIDAYLATGKRPKLTAR